MQIQTRCCSDTFMESDVVVHFLFKFSHQYFMSRFTDSLVCRGGASIRVTETHARLWRARSSCGECMGVSTHYIYIYIYIYLPLTQTLMMCRVWTESFFDKVIIPVLISFSWLYCIVRCRVQCACHAQISATQWGDLSCNLFCLLKHLPSYVSSNTQCKCIIIQYKLIIPESMYIK